VQCGDIRHPRQDYATARGDPGTSDNTGEATVDRYTNVPYRMTSNTKPHYDGASLPMSGRPFRPNWLAYTNMSRHLRQVGPPRLSMRCGSSPLSPGPARMWPRWWCFWTHCLYPPPIGWVRCMGGSKASSLPPPRSRRRAPCCIGSRLLV
jgi:hypothetical protein